MTLTATTCPGCGGWFEIEHPALRLEVECPDCEEILAVVATDPVELAPARDADLAPFYPSDDRPA